VDIIQKLQELQEVDIIQKLQELQEKENRRRATAVSYLEKLEEELAPMFENIVGENTNPEYMNVLWVAVFDKAQGKYTPKHSSLYFRYTTWRGEKQSEPPGFYIDYTRYGVWGNPLTEVRGKDFWQYLKQVTDWLVDYLPGWIEQNDKSRDQRFERFVNIVRAIAEK